MKKILKIKRQDRLGRESYWDDFVIQATPNMTISGALKEIERQPINARQEKVAPVAWDWNCGQGVCGSCAMMVNGKPALACQTPMAGLKEPIVVEPLHRFPVLRDLVSDRTLFFDHLKQFSVWPEIDAVVNPDADPRASRENLAALSGCIQCGLCVEVCPQVSDHSPFAGAAILHEAHRADLFPTSVETKEARLGKLIGPAGIENCGQSQNCTRACPQKLPLSSVMSEISADVGRRVVKKMLGE